MVSVHGSTLADHRPAWVISVRTDVDVSKKTSGDVWQQSWHLVTDGEATARDLAASGRAGPLSLEDVRHAIYLEANDGSWAIFSLRSDLTLITYNLTVALAGWIPNGMAARFAMSSLEDLLNRVAANAAVMPLHYVDGHVTIYAGDGRPIPPGTLARSRGDRWPTAFEKAHQLGNGDCANQRCKGLSQPEQLLPERVIESLSGKEFFR